MAGELLRFFSPLTPLHTLSKGTSVLPINVVIVGASGYSGVELVTLLAAHPSVCIAGLFGSAKREGAPEAYSHLFPRLKGIVDLPIRASDPEAIVECKPDFVFLATPHEASLELAPRLLSRGTRVLDLSAAFRLKDSSLYPRHYAFDHTHPHLLREAVYGLPELFRDAIRDARLIAVPGCYPTSAILPLAPLVKAGAVATNPATGAPRLITIDSTSGVSGAGRAASVKNLFCEVSQQAYGVLSHRHNPEIDAYSGSPTIFTPHVGPYERGIVSTIHVDLAPGWNASHVEETLGKVYDLEPFVRLLTREGRTVHWPSVLGVRHTNFCDIAFAVSTGHARLVLSSALDNLVKGAAGQAVQCLNAAAGLDETTGLFSRHIEGHHTHA